MVVLRVGRERKVCNGGVETQGHFYMDMTLFCFIFNPHY